jgi:hypothetical protein
MPTNLVKIFFGFKCKFVHLSNFVGWEEIFLLVNYIRKEIQGFQQVSRCFENNLSMVFTSFFYTLVLHNWKTWLLITLAF